MAIEANTLYVVNAGGPQNVQIFDITNRTNPVPVGNFGGGDLSNPNAILLFGAYLFITNLNTSTVAVYHTGIDPHNPQKVTEFGGGELSLPNGLANFANILYISNAFDSTIEIYDITDPESPVRIGEFGDSDEITHPIGLAVFGNTLYVANFDGAHGNTISVYNIEDPENPQFVRRFGSGLLSGPTEMAIFIDLLYVVNENDNSIEVFDLSEDPRDPSHIGEFSGNLSEPFGIIVVEPLAP